MVKKKVEELLSHCLIVPKMKTLFVTVFLLCSGMRSNPYKRMQDYQHIQRTMLED